MDDPTVLIPLAGVLLGLLCFWGAFRSGRRWRLVENLPTSKTTGVFIGLVELKGTAESARPLVSYLAEESCVCYQWSIEEDWSREVTETHTDEHGNTHTETHTEHGSTTVAQGGEMIPFYLQDDCGVILIRPEGAKLEPVTMFRKSCGRRDPLYYGKGPAQGVAGSDEYRHFSERGIPLRKTLYVIGQARERQDVVAAEIAADRRAPMFLISTRSQQQVSSGMKWAERFWVLFALLLMVAGVVAWDLASGARRDPQLWLYGAAAAGAIALGATFWVWMVFNSLVDLRQRVRAAWSLVEVQLKRRADLIPNLVALVVGARDYERQVQTELAALRGELAATPPGVAGPDYAAVGKTVACIAERCPDLKANTAFLGLQKNLVETEERIALARGYFNEIAAHYNTRLEIVPERFVAALAGMRPQVLMAANDFQRAAVTV
jgi:hypothetical protein